MRTHTVVQNLGHAIVRKMAIKISGKEVVSLNYSDIYHWYLDLGCTTRDRENVHYQDIDTAGLRNTTGLRVAAANTVPSVVDSAVADTYKNWYFISSLTLSFSRATCRTPNIRWEKARVRAYRQWLPSDAVHWWHECNILSQRLKSGV